MKKIKLTGPRIILRPLKISDVFDIYSNIKRDPQIAEKIRWVSYPFKLRDAKKFIQKAQKNLRAKKDFVFGIELKNKKEIIGCVNLHDFNSESEVEEHEIGYWVGKKYRGKGLATEALALVLDFFFKKLKLHRIWAEVSIDNLASQKLLESLGFKKEGRHREAYWRRDHWVDNLIYGLLDREFLRKKK